MIDAAQVVVFSTRTRYKKAACFATRQYVLKCSKLDFRFTLPSCAFHSFFLKPVDLADYPFSRCLDTLIHSFFIANTLSIPGQDSLSNLQRLRKIPT